MVFLLLLDRISGFGCVYGGGAEILGCGGFTGGIGNVDEDGEAEGNKIKKRRRIVPAPFVCVLIVD